MGKSYMAIDQYGNTIHNLKHPRKDLLNRLDRQHADKMYVDKKDGTSKHIGYIVSGRWFRIFEVIPWEKSA